MGIDFSRSLRRTGEQESDSSFTLISHPATTRKRSDPFEIGQGRNPKRSRVGEQRDVDNLGCRGGEGGFKIGDVVYRPRFNPEAPGAESLDYTAMDTSNSSVSGFNPLF